MIIDPLPPTTNYGIWSEMVEYVDTEDNSFIDFSPYPEIRLEVIDPFSRTPMLTLTKSAGELTTPAPGMIEWYVDAGRMGGFRPGYYEVRMAVQLSNNILDLLAIMKSSVNVVE